MGLVLADQGQEYAFWDALLQISAEYPIRSYLEVGTRYGDSLLRVLALRRLDRIVIADIWHESYFGNGSGTGTNFDRSHKHVERMLRCMGYEKLLVNGEITFLDGDSAKTIPTLDRRQPFDLVTVDGDHDNEPATADVWNCWPLVAPGGFLVFDDIQGVEHMAHIWTHFTRNAPDLAANYVRIDKKFGVAVAEKTRTYLETTKIRKHILDAYPSYFGANPDVVKGIDIGCSRDPLTRTCVAFDQTDWPEVTRRGDARALPFDDAAFDWVWSSHCLEDLEDTASTLKEWLRVLRPGGTIGLYVPHPELYKGTNTEHKHSGFTPEQLRDLLLPLGCFIVESMIHDIPEGPYPCYSTLVVARKPE